MSKSKLAKIGNGRPPARSIRGCPVGTSKYPYKSLRVGAWFLFPADLGIRAARQNTYARNRVETRLKSGRKYECFKTTEGMCCRRVS